MIFSELHIREGIEDNSKIIFLFGNENIIMLPYFFGYKT